MKKKSTKSMDMRKTKATNNSITWVAPDFVYYKKSTNWYITISVIALVLIMIFYFTKIYSGIAVVLAAILALFMNANTKPENIEYTINNNGISFKKKKFTYNDLKSFYLSNKSGFFRLILEQKGKFKPHLVIIIDNINPILIRNFLVNKLPENPKLAQFLHDRMTDLVGF